MSSFISISNNELNVSIATKGAELQSIVLKATGIEYMWNADPNYWSKKSPVLFPIVGGLKNNSYTYNGNNYSLNRHGFARETEFKVTNHTANSVTFSISNNATTMAVYPFSFIFSITYTLHHNKLLVSYTTENTGATNMFFSVGAHPAFKIPLLNNTNFEDYFLAFNEPENAGIYPLDANGLLETQAIPFLHNQQQLPLSKSLFYKDALVFKELKSNTISIKSKAHPHGLSVGFDGFPFMGIWSAKNANFVCIEPWCGIADSVNTNGVLETKEGIILLVPSTNITKQWWASFF